MNGIAGKGSEYESKAAQDIIGKAAKLIANPTDVNEQQKRLLADKERQNSISEYNIDLANAHEDVRFRNKIFVGNSVIIKLEKINWLIPSNFEEGLHTLNPLYFLNVVTPDYPQGKIIQNPFPYGYRGTVVAVGDEVAKYRSEKGLESIVIGDTVELGWFDLKEYRYYPDKQKVDQVTLDNPIAPNYEGFAKLPAQMVEALIPAGLYEEVYGKREDVFSVVVAEVTTADYM